MQTNYLTAVPAERALVLGAPPIALPKPARAPTLVRTPPRPWPGLEHKDSRGQMWETVAWFALVLSSLLALVACLDF